MDLDPVGEPIFIPHFIRTSTHLPIHVLVVGVSLYKEKDAQKTITSFFPIFSFISLRLNQWMYVSSHGKDAM